MSRQSFSLMSRGSSSLTSRLWEASTWIAAAIVAAGCILVIGFVIKEGASSITWDFLTTDPEVSILDAEQSGIRVPMVGTTLLIVLSMLVTVPLALASAIYLAEYMDERSWFTQAIRMGLEVLASVPSVVFGMFGLALFSSRHLAFMSSSGAIGADAAFGRSFLVAGIVMAVHVLPFVAKVMEEAIRAVPNAYRSAAAGLGFTKLAGIRKVVLPTARPGLATAVILGMGLVAGDTAIVWLTLGGTVTMASEQWWNPANWVEVIRGTGSTLTTFAYFTSPVGEGTAPELAFGAALILMVLVLSLNVMAMIVGSRGRSNDGR